MMTEPESRRSWLVDVLAALFAVGSWLCVHGLWVELPLLVQDLPEGWSLPSYFSVVICVSNVAPISYSLLNHGWPGVVTEKRCVYVSVAVGFVSTLLIAEFWRGTSYLWGRERSTTLLCLVFFFGMVDCSSRVLYVPFMSNFKEEYLTSFFIGEGLSALIPSALALVQGVGGAPECKLLNSTVVAGEEVRKYVAVTPPPLFSVRTFFYMILGVVVLSATAFHLLNYKVVVKGAVSTAEVDAGYEKCRGKGAKEAARSRENVEVLEMSPSNSTNGANTASCKELAAESKPAGEPQSCFLYAVALQLAICFVSNGILLSIQSFSSLPYGNGPFHLVVTLTTMVNPLICFAFFVLPKPGRTVINVYCLLAAPLTCYVVATAVLSPAPPLVGTKWGEMLIVAAWVLLTAIYVYVKVGLATLLRGSDGKRGLFWFGASTQIGSASGGVFSFLLINCTGIFHSFDACDGLN